LTLTAKRVTALPLIDGSASDDAWKSAKAMAAGTTSWRAVYDAGELALLVTWPDRNLVIDTVRCWHWDASKQGWYTTKSTLTTGVKYPKRFFGIAFDIANSTIRTEGCAAFCHQDGAVQHHNTTAPDAYVDVWLLLGKHGFGPASGGASFGTGDQDVGWLAGAESVTQSGDVLFDPEDKLNPRSPIVGTFTFVGFAEDKSISPKGDDTFASKDKPALQYCARCHDNKPGVKDLLAGLKMEDARTFGDAGEIPYLRNGDLADAVPLYIEVSPVDFADALVLTQAEIDAGEAVAVAGLTAGQIGQSWARYVQLNAVVPELVLKTPSGSAADVRVAATWHSGVWTLELRRKLVTGSPDDVAFSDLTRPYAFTLTMPGGPAPLLKSGGTNLVFEP